MKSSEMWNSRWFVLADGYLTYFKSYRVRYTYLVQLELDKVVVASSASCPVFFTTCFGCVCLRHLLISLEKKLSSDVAALPCLVSETDFTCFVLLCMKVPSSPHPDQQDRAAKCVIPLTHLNVLMNGPGLESHPNSMLLAFWEEKLKKTRHVFVYAELAKVCL